MQVVRDLQAKRRLERDRARVKKRRPTPSCPATTTASNTREKQRYEGPMTGRRNCRARERTCWAGCDRDNDNNTATASKRRVGQAVQCSSG